MALMVNAMIRARSVLHALASPCYFHSRAFPYGRDDLRTTDGGRHSTTASRLSSFRPAPMTTCGSPWQARAAAPVYRPRKDVRETAASRSVSARPQGCQAVHAGQPGPFPRRARAKYCLHGHAPAGFARRRARPRLGEDDGERASRDRSRFEIAVHSAHHAIVRAVTRQKLPCRAAMWS